MSEKLYSWRYVKNNVGIYQLYNAPNNYTIFVTTQNPNRRNGKITLFIEDFIQVASNDAWCLNQFKKIDKINNNADLVYWSTVVDKVNN